MTIYHDHFGLNPVIQTVSLKKKIRQGNSPHKPSTIIHCINRIKNKNHFII